MTSSLLLLPLYTVPIGKELSRVILHINHIISSIIRITVIKFIFYIRVPNVNPNTKTEVKSKFTIHEGVGSSPSPLAVCIDTAINTNNIQHTEATIPNICNANIVIFLKV